MGIGLIVVGLASVILGQAILGQRRVWIAVLAVILGAVLYRLIIFAALRVGLDPNDMKAVSAVLVVAAMLLPRWTEKFKRRPAPAGSTGTADSGSTPEPVASGKEN